MFASIARLSLESPSHLLIASTRPLMRRQSETPSPFLSRCLHLYAILVTIYALWKLRISVLPYQSLSRNHLLRLPRPRITFPSNITVQQAEEFLWSNFSHSGQNSLVPWDPILSRAFPRLMHPSRIIPFYYRATGNFENDDITITTLISSDRFLVFRNLVRRYKGALIPATHSADLPSSSI